MKQENSVAKLGISGVYGGEDVNRTRQHRSQHPAHGEVFGLWRERPEGSLALQDTLRQEWSTR